MKITTERVGDSVLLALENSQYAITALLTVELAATLGANLIMQSALLTEAEAVFDGLELPETFRPTKEV